MLITRRRWLSITLGSPVVAVAQGGRAGTATDRLSGDWLCGEVRRAGLAPTREPFSLNRVDPITNVLIAGDRRIEGVPLFDGAFTGADGVSGRLGALDSDAEIGLAETATNAAASGALGDARRRRIALHCIAVDAAERPTVDLLNEQH